MSIYKINVKFSDLHIFLVCLEKCNMTVSSYYTLKKKNAKCHNGLGVH